MGYDGSSWLPPAAYITQVSTAISRISTPEGFVIASDSRKTTNRSEIVDGCAKIFPIERADARLAYGLAGATTITRGDGPVVFDFQKETAQAVEYLSEAKMKTWWDFLEALRECVIAPLNESRIKFAWNPSEAEETEIFIGGFFGKHPKCAKISFQHGIESTEAECFPEDRRPDDQRHRGHSPRCRRRGPQSQRRGSQRARLEADHGAHARLDAGRNRPPAPRTGDAAGAEHRGSAPYPVRGVHPCNPANPGLIQKISEQLGVQKLIPNVLPDNMEVR